MTKASPPRAKCVFRSPRGSRTEITGDIPTALLMGFYSLDDAEQRTAVLSDLGKAHSELLAQESRATEAA